MSKSGHEGKKALEAGTLFYNERGTLAVPPSLIEDRLKQGKRFVEIYDTAHAQAVLAGSSPRTAQAAARQAVDDFLALWKIADSDVESYFTTALAILQAYEDAYSFKLERTSDETAAKDFALSNLKSAASALHIEDIIARFEQAKELKAVYDYGIHTALKEDATDPHAYGLHRVATRIKLWQVPAGDIGPRMLVARAFYDTVDWGILTALPWSFLEAANGLKLDNDYRKKLIELEYYSRLADAVDCEWVITTDLEKFSTYARVSNWQEYSNEITMKHLMLQEYLGDVLTETEIDQLQQYRQDLAVQEAQAAVRAAEEALRIEQQADLEEEIAPENTDTTLLAPAEPLVPFMNFAQQGQVDSDWVEIIRQAIQEMLPDSTELKAKDETILALQTLVEELRSELSRLTVWVDSAKVEYQKTVDDYNKLLEEHEILQREREEQKQAVATVLQNARRGVTSLEDGITFIRESLKLLAENE